MAHFQDDQHALHTGMLVGALMKAGIMVIMGLDDEQNYTNDLTLIFPGDRFVDELAVHIKVLPGEPEQVVRDSV